MRLKVLNIKDVAETHLCCGCGVCGHLDPGQIQIVDDIEVGRRPLIAGTPEMTPAHAAAFAACPGHHLAHEYDPNEPRLIRELEESWGPVHSIWEGHATDPEIRFSGSSGGVATALAVFCMEQKGFAGTLHIGARKDVPYLNETVFSTAREGLLVRTGSRYAPASPCDRLDLIEDAGSPCVFIGKPCDVAATFKARKNRPQLDRNLGLTIGIFCAGTPSSRGTLEVLKAMGIDDLSAIRSIRYRGNGWPGMFAVELETPVRTEKREMTYAKSWGDILQKHRQWRCYICPDHTGEFADIAVGDPWHEPPDGTDPGRSLVLARTDRGRQVIESAIAAGVLQLQPVKPCVLPNSQPHVLRVRMNVWPRVFVMRLMGAATPTYTGMSSRPLWQHATGIVTKLRTLAATAKRVIDKSLLRRRPVTQIEVDPRRKPLQPRVSLGTLSSEQADIP